jgi:hypothetical protein
MTQTLLGFWAVERPSYYITRTIILMCADDGFGNLINIPRNSFPSYLINSLDFTS